MLEIELNESLRRRREELQSKLELLGEAESETAFNPSDLENRVRELKLLNSSIADLQKKTAGKTSLNINVGSS